MLIREVLKAKSGGVIVVRTGATVADAVGLLVAHNIGSLPVLDDAGALVGIFSERDLLIGVQEHGPSYLQMFVQEVMTPNPFTCSPHDEVHLVMGQMSRHRVGQLPVVADDELVGLVSAGDMVRCLYDRTEAENRHLYGYLYGTYEAP
jgi:CBS domain-containing protein